MLVGGFGGILWLFGAKTGSDFWCMASTLARYLLLKNKICTPSMSVFAKNGLRLVW